MPAVCAPKRCISHSRNPISSCNITMLQPFYISLRIFRILTMAERSSKSRPTRIPYRTTFRTSPTEIGPLYIVIEQTFRLILCHNRFHIRSQPFRVIGTPVKPNQEQVSITRTKFLHHLFTITLIPLLAVGGKFSSTGNLEIMDSQQRIPTDTDINTRLDSVFPAGIHKITDYVTFSVTPFHCFQTIRIHITLPKSEARFMRSGQYGELTSGRFSSPNPLVGIQTIGREYVVIFNRLNPIVTLSITDSIEHMQVIMENSPHLGFMPFKLMRSRNRKALCVTGRYAQHPSQ